MGTQTGENRAEGVKTKRHQGPHPDPAASRGQKEGEPATGAEKSLRGRRKIHLLELLL